MTRPPTDMERRVAKALETHLKVFGCCGGGEDYYCDPYVGFIEDAARAAIRALYEPSDEMKEVWAPAFDPRYEDAESYATRVWQAMISAASPQE